jgi:hypothetical protein
MNNLVSFGMLLGHLLGDYILQNDWISKRKSAKSPKHLAPRPTRPIDPPDALMPKAALAMAQSLWDDDYKIAKEASLACTLHCLLYTLAVWACTFWWMPWWGLVVCFAVHWPIDRYRLARWWMEKVSGQETFANAFSRGNLPWGLIIVDNIAHLSTLWVIALIVFWGT